MTTAVQIISPVFLVMSGLLAGTLFMVEIALVPTLGALPADRWRQVHLLLDRRFDPLMPRINRVTLAFGVVLAIFAGNWPARIAFAVGVIGVIGVAVVSEAFNVRMNRVVEHWNPDAIPSDWAWLRSRWAAWNRVRTLVALAGFVGAAVGAALV
jgi:uncharacterized membrane protein